MYFDLFVPFPVPQSLADQAGKKGKKDKGKGKQQQQPDGQGKQEEKEYWSAITQLEREKCTRSIALAGHLGYDVVGCTISSDPTSSVIPNPFSRRLPFPDLDPRQSNASASASAGSSSNKGGGRGRVVQVSRFHMRLDDHKTHCFAASNTNALREYDILSVAPTSDKALQLACTDLCMPGPNQISIITLPLHERPYFFRLNRKQIRQAQRNGVVLELIYSPALFPSPSIPAEVARRFRQNFFTNAREVIRITGGKGVILSSGPGDSMRAPIDLINLASVLGVPANLAKDAVSLNGKMVLLRAQARRTFKAVFAAPKLVPSLSEARVGEDDDVGKRKLDDTTSTEKEGSVKKTKT